jgi:uncharacterized protein with PIN domain
MNASKGSSVLPRFAADTMLAGLARWLRFLGYDTDLREEPDWKVWLEQAEDQGRIVLTRRRMGKDGAAGERVVQIEAGHPGMQIAEVIHKTGLNVRDHRFRLCSLCNTSVRPVSREVAAGRVEPGVYNQYDVYWMCPQCGRIYWKGGHWMRIEAWLDKWADVENNECQDPEEVKD